MPKFDHDKTTENLNELREKYPAAKSYDLDGRGQHFVAEVEPASEHPEYDRAIEVIFSSVPHKHLKTTQYYKGISGILELHVGEQVVTLCAGDKFTIDPGLVHFAQSDDGVWVEILSRPGWTAEDHIIVSDYNKK